MKAFLYSAAIILLSAFTAADALTGKWETIQADGTTLGVIFKEDRSLVWYQNKKPFVSGAYTFENNVFTIDGNGCPGMPGVYKVNFFSNADSLRWQVISDSCAPRRNAINNIAFGKVK